MLLSSSPVKDTALSRLKLEFKSRWEHLKQGVIYKCHKCPPLFVVGKFCVSKKQDSNIVLAQRN